MGIRPTETIEREEVEAIKALLDRRRKEDVRVLAIITALSYGLRREEVLRLNVGDYRRIDGHPCLVPQTVKQKRDAHRVMPITAADADLLDKYLRWEHGSEAKADTAMFLTLGKHHPCRRVRLTARAVDYHVKRLVERAGLEKRLSAHSFRHGFASRLVRAGTDLQTLRELLGHRCLTSTSRYTHATFEDKKEAVRRVHFA